MIKTCHGEKEVAWMLTYSFPFMFWQLSSDVRASELSAAVALCGVVYHLLRSRPIQTLQDLVGERSRNSCSVVY